MNTKDYKLLFWLFRTQLLISSFTVGGGYVVITMIRKYFVLKRQMLSEEELLEMAAIAQSSPGAIAINFATLVGYKLAGLKGSIVSLLGAIIPPFIILSIISHYYQLFFSYPIIRACLNGMQIGVAILILDVVYNMSKVICLQRSLFFIMIIPLSFILSYIMQVNVMLIVIFSAIVSLFYYFWEMKK